MNRYSTRRGYLFLLQSQPRQMAEFRRRREPQGFPVGAKPPVH